MRMKKRKLLNMFNLKARIVSFINICLLKILELLDLLLVLFYELCSLRWFSSKDCLKIMTIKC